MNEQKLIYPFDYLHHRVATVALYGTNNPLVVVGNLVLRTYYTDDTKKNVDIDHTSEYVLDAVFYETNKVIRESLDDPYNGKRELVEVPMPQLGPGYCVIYNEAEIPSQRHDDFITILGHLEDDPHGVAIIMKRLEDGSLTWLGEKEARKLAAKMR